MNLQTFRRTILGAGLSALLTVGAAHAQTAGQDMHAAGHDTKNAAVNTGHATKKGYHKTVRGTKTGYHKSVNATKEGYHKTGNGISKLGDKMSGHPNQ